MEDFDENSLGDEFEDDIDALGLDD